MLVGSQTFWEGVDVRGEALSLVVIDRLPFAPPDDPVLAARIERINRNGRNAFMEYQVPAGGDHAQAGSGAVDPRRNRSRRADDLRPRLITKPYGRRIWQSLPPMKRTRNEEEAVAFFEPTHGDVSGVLSGRGGLRRTARFCRRETQLTDLEADQSNVFFQGVQLIRVREGHADLRDRVIDAVEPLEQRGNPLRAVDALPPPARGI